MSTRKRVAMAGRVLALVLVAGSLPLPGSDVAWAQVAPEAPVLQGRVLDAETGFPLVGVWVGLEGEDWGTLTNAEGRFHLPDVPMGARSYEFDMLGFTRTTIVIDASADPDVTVELIPEPLLLEGIEIVTDRFESRRKATATSVRAIEREELLRTAAWDVMNLLERRFGLRQTSCSGATYGRGVYRRAAEALGAWDCAWVRGRPTPVTVCIDEMPVLGGMDFLRSYQPHELYMVEVYGQGRQIRLYTNQFMERAGRIRLHPAPLAASFC